MRTKKMQFIHNNETLVKIRYNEKFSFYEALTAAIDPQTKEKIQNFGNDWNVTGATPEEVKRKVINILND